MRKSTAFGLASIVLGSIAIRLSPLLTYLYWGSDTAEYLVILRGLVQTGHVSTVYYGWGITYPYFPGMFFAQAGLVDLGRPDIPTVLDLLIPTAYTAAHPAPATLGFLLALTSLLLFLRLRTDRQAIVPLLLTTVSLVMTHHLSLYFFAIMVLGVIFVQGLARPWTWTAGARREIVYAGALLALTFTYWLGYATTFRESILPDVSIQPWWALLALFPVGLVLLGAIVYARSRITRRYRPTYPSLRYRTAAYVAAVLPIVIVGIVSVLVGVPGTTFRVRATDLLYFAPLILLIAFSAPARKFLDFLSDGLQPTAWFLALLASAVVGILAAPHVLIPYRHMEYLLIPFAIFAGVGFFRILDLAGLRGSRRALALLAGGLLLGANAVVGIQPPSTLAGWREGTPPSAVDPAYWV